MDRVETDNLAVPAFTVELPSAALPSKNVTVPVASAGDTVAVNVTACPTSSGLRLDTAVTVEGLVPTVCVKTAVLPVQLLSPLYTTVME